MVTLTTRVLLCWGLLLCVLAFSEDTADDSSASKTISADDFLKRLHLKAPDHQAPLQQRRAPVALRRAHRVSLDQEAVTQTDPLPSPAIRKQRAQAELSDTEADLGEGSSVQTDSTQSVWQLHIPKSKSQEHKRLLAQAKKHFPETELQISDLQKQLGEHRKAVHRAELAAQKSKRDYEQKLGKAQKTESVHEFAMMTDPDIEQAAMKVDLGLSELKQTLDDAESKLDLKKDAEKSLQKKLKDKLQERETNTKAVKLFEKFKKRYDKKLSTHLATVSAEFHDKALKAALSLAKKKFSEYKKPFDEEQAALKKQQERKQAEQQKHLAQIKADMDAKEKSDARAMFKAYLQRFHEMQQRTAMEEVEQDLGESGDVSDDSKASKVKVHSFESSEESTLDSISQMIGGK